jgi:hypothetical protein
MRIYQPTDGPDRLPQAMVEGSTEYDWAELPDWLKDSIRNAAKDLKHWADNQTAPIEGQLANEIEGGRG